MVSYAQLAAGAAIVAGLLLLSSATECELTEWNQWSPCIGTCFLSMRARNRDVARPPFPEARGGRLAMEQCPPLYEVQQCIIQSCPENATSPNQLGTLELTTIANNLVSLDTKQTKLETVLKNEENVQKSVTRTLDLAAEGIIAKIAGFSPSVISQEENKAADSTTPSPLSATLNPAQEELLQSYGATVTPKPNTFPPHFFPPVDFEEDLPRSPPTSSPPLLSLFETEPQLRPQPQPRPQPASVEISQQTFNFAGTSPSEITPVVETTSSTLSPLQQVLLEHHQKNLVSSQIQTLPPADPPPPPANPPLPIPDNPALPVAHVNRLPDTNALQLLPNAPLSVPQLAPAPAQNAPVATVNSTANPSLAILKNPSWSEASLTKALHKALRPFIVNQDTNSPPQDNIPAQRGPKNFVLDFANAKLPKPGNFILFAGLPTPRPSKVQGDFGHLTVDESELPEPKPFPLINYNSEAIVDNNAFQIQAGNGQFIVPVDNQLNPNPLLKPVSNLAPNKEIDLFGEEPGNDESDVTLQTLSAQSWTTDPQPIQTEGVFQDTNSTIRETRLVTSSIQFSTIIPTTEKTLEPTKIYARENSARNDSNNSEIVDSSVSPITKSSKRLDGELFFNKTNFINTATSLQHREETFAAILPIKPINVKEEEAVYDLNFVVQLNQTVRYNSSSDTTNVTARPSTSPITSGKTPEIIQKSKISVSESATTKQGDENVDEEDLSQFELFINNTGQTLSVLPSNSSSTTKSLESSGYSKITTEDLLRTTKENVVLLQTQTPEFIRISSQSSSSVLTNEAKNPSITLRQILTNYLNATQEPIISVQPISKLVSYNKTTISPSSSSSLSANSISSSSISTTSVPDDSTDQQSLSSRSTEKVTVLPSISYSTSKLSNVTSPTPTSTIPSSSSSVSIFVSTSTTTQAISTSTTQAVSTSTTPSVSSSVPIFISTSKLNHATIKQPIDVDNSRSSEKFLTSSRLLSTLESTTIAPFTKVTSLESTSSHFPINSGVAVANSNAPTSSKSSSTELLVSNTNGNIKISTSNLKSAELQTTTTSIVPLITTSLSSVGSSGIQLVTNALTPSSLSNSLPSLETESSVSVNANKTIPISPSITASNLPIFTQNISLSGPSLNNSVIIQNTNPLSVSTSSSTKLPVSSSTYPSVIVFGKKPGEFASSNPLDSSVWIPVQQIRRKVSPDVVEINGNFVQPTSSETKDKSGFINLLNHLIVPTSTEGPHVPCAAAYGNKRCCRAPVRSKCPDGKQSQTVMRWFRVAGQTECSSYNYGYCGLDFELQDQPIKFEEECYDLCYSDVEKQNLPIFNEIRFANGFRLNRRRNKIV